MHVSKCPEFHLTNIEQYEYYHETKQGNDKFGKWLGRQDWREVLQAVGVDAKVDQLHAKFKEGTALSYEWKIRRKKSCEPVWMTDELREMIRRRRNASMLEYGSVCVTRCRWLRGVGTLDPLLMGSSPRPSWTPDPMGTP